MRKDMKAYKILVVEDNDGDFILVEELLNEQIADPLIVRATDFSQAVGIISSGFHLFNVLLLDLSLPDKRSDDVVREMLRIAAACPIIVLTGCTDIDFSIRSITYGISDYLIKDGLNGTLLYKSIVYSIERKRSISLVANSEERYSALFNSSRQPNWLFDPESFRFVQVNKATIDLYGYTEEEFLGMSQGDIEINAFVLKSTKRLRSRRPADEVSIKTVQHHKKSCELIEVEMYSSPITIGEKNLVAVIAIDVTEKNVAQQNTIRSIITAQENERYEIGSELHDNVCQILAASQIYLGILKHSMTESGTVPYDVCKKNLSLAIEEIRSLSHRLAPAFFSDSTMQEDFKRLLETFNAEKKVAIALHFDTAADNYPVSLDMKLNLYRILQEQLSNIQKYAHATLIEVDVLLHLKRIKMRIWDDGIGFNMSKVKNGIGLANIKIRTELFRGSFQLFSSAGAGCEVIIDIPLPKG